MKTLIKKLLAWVLKDDLKKLRRRILSLETDLSFSSRYLRRLISEQQKEILGTVTSGISVLQKWKFKPEALMKAHVKAVDILEAAYLKHDELNRGRIKISEEATRAGEAFHSASELEAELRKDMNDMIPILGEPLASEMRIQAQTWIIDFENPQVL